MTRGLALACLLLAASPALRAEDAAAVSSTAATGPAAPAPWKDSGFEYCFGATALSVFNASPLAFSPFELGWRFANGLHVRTGVDVFYYEGLDSNSKEPAQGLRLYSYEMRNLRSSLLYSVPLPGRIRPMAGMTFEVMGGTRKLTGLGVLNPATLDAWGFLGTGAVLGVEGRLSEHWSLEARGSYTFSFSAVGAVTALGLNLAYLL